MLTNTEKFHDNLKTALQICQAMKSWNVLTVFRKFSKTFWTVIKLKHETYVIVVRYKFLLLNFQCKLDIVFNCENC